MSDKTIVCKDCNADFVFTQNEQDFYREKGFENEPLRCPDCRSARKRQSRGGGNFRGGERTMYPTVCSECGVSTTVPFEPSGDKPVYCKDCYQSRR